MAQSILMKQAKAKIRTTIFGKKDVWISIPEVPNLGLYDQHEEEC